MSADVIQLADRRRKPASIDALEEARIDLTVSLAERFTYVTGEHDAWRAVLFCEAKGDYERIGRIAAARLRMAVQERTRAAAAFSPEPGPVAMDRAA